MAKGIAAKLLKERIKRNRVASEGSKSVQGTRNMTPGEAKREVEKKNRTGVWA